MNFIKSPNINYLWANLIIEELVRNGVEHFCLSSGSRSSALTLAVASNPKAKSYIHFDERSSAYRALGLISATKKPCVIITTSGTAAANVFPAVVEASKKKIPLIVLTADRPPELRWTGAHQTIDQTKIYGEYARWFFDMPCPTAEIPPEFVLTTVDQAVSRAQGNPGGPVHLNCMFREPLAPVKNNSITASYTKSIQSWQKSTSAYTQYIKPQIKPDTQSIENIAERIGGIKKGVVVVGKLPDKKAQNAVLKLSEMLNWPVFVDIASGLRLGNDHKNVIQYFDQMLLSDKFKNNFKPDGVLHLGGRITSKRWYQFVEHIKPSQYIMALDHPLRNDPLHNVTTRIQCAVSTLTGALTKRLSKRNNSKNILELRKLNTLIDETIGGYFKAQDALSEPYTSRLITQNIKANSGLFVSSSMPIRELDMYGDPKFAGIQLGSNRGASGIDGVIATAAGFASGLNKPTTLLIGDLAFLYDLNSLAMLKELSQPMAIVVLNNNGGGIFSFLPIQKIGAQFEKYFGTPHNLSFHAAADLFDLNYARPESAEEFIQTYNLALGGRTSTIIEIQNDRDDNLKTHDQLQSLITNNINKHLNGKRGPHHDKKHNTIRKTVGLANSRKLRRYQVR